jgi:hypothetical protein
MISESLGKPLAIITLGACIVASPPTAAQSRGTGKPQLTVRVNPPTGFVPFRAVFTAELVGGANDYEEYYCARVEWDWADETRSEFGADCEPYEKGKSEIRRRFTHEHTFRVPGNFEVAFRLKQGTKVVAAGKVMVQVRDERNFEPRTSNLECVAKLAVAWVTADGAAPRGAQPTSVNKRFAASTTWGCPRAGPARLLISQRTLRSPVYTCFETRARLICSAWLCAWDA